MRSKQIPEGLKDKSTPDSCYSQHLSQMKETKYSYRGNILKQHPSKRWLRCAKLTNVEMLWVAIALLLIGLPDSQFVRYSHAQDSPINSPAESSSSSTESPPEEVVTGNNGPTPVVDENPGGDVTPEATNNDGAATPPPAPVMEPLPAEPSEEATESPTQSPPTEPPATEPPVTEPPVTEPPATEPPATESPPTEPPPTDPPATDPPATEPPPTTPNPCASLTCHNGGTCDIRENNEPYCECDVGWTGEDCNTGKNPLHTLYSILFVIIPLFVLLIAIVSYSVKADF